MHNSSSQFKDSITVLMCVFNGEKWLTDCIKSIQNQTIKEFQFLIINDGSTDNSLKIIKKFQKSDHRINLINQKNIGLTKSLNKGLRIANSKWIARIDADDISIKTRLEEQLRYAKKYKLDLIGSKAKLISSKGIFIGDINCPTSEIKLRKNLLKQGVMFPHSSAFYLLEKVLLVGGYRDYFDRSQDYDLWLRMAEKYKIGCLKKKCVYIRTHNERVTNKEYGLNQRLMAHCGLTSYYIRMINREGEEYIFSSKNNFIQFKSFVLNKIKKYGFLDLYKQLFLLKQKLNSKVKKNYFFNKFIIVLFYFNRPKILFRLFHWFLFKDRISKFIAYKWIENFLKNEKN